MLMALTDTSPMPFGQYEGYDMQDVPAKYLVWLYDNNKCNAEVREYVRENLETLKQEIKQNL